MSLPAEGKKEERTARTDRPIENRVRGGKRKTRMAEMTRNQKKQKR